MYKRYAIYFTPPPGDFARRGAAWLGWDIATGQEVLQPEFQGFDLGAITARPRKYGLHGTIKPPFTLTDGCSEEDLISALAAFCETRSVISLDGLALAKIGRFLALTPTGDATALANLAGDAVRALDSYRAPLSDEERDRKDNPNLSDKQREYLVKWGYPYVMEHFQFHITLTSPLKPQVQHTVCAALDEYLGAVIPSQFVIDSLTICGELEDGRFREIVRFKLPADC